MTGYTSIWSQVTENVTASRRLCLTFKPFFCNIFSSQY
uniref:Uncharacterized protein n=1 Tax=Anguilla anguilla TaxID=7936 RepID=A0A0E9RH40_ANGAN